MELPQISDSELELLRIIWANGGRVLFAQVMAELEAQEKEWKTNTVLTFLSRLVEKKMLSVKKQGRRNEYIALISEKDYAAHQTDAFLDRVYDGNVRGLVSALLSQNRLTAADLEELKQFWNGEEGKP